MSNTKTALVTGSTDGVGRLVALRLADRGTRVLVHGRDASRGGEVVREIGSKGARSDFLRADFASLAEVRDLAGAVRDRADRLDLLVNNAGIGMGASDPGRGTSADGHELRFAVNYLAGFLLTRLLLPLIRRSAPARIVNVSSIGQQPIDFSDVMLTRDYDGTRAYCQSKLAQVMFTIDLAEELRPDGIDVNALHPATFMDTTLVRRDGIRPRSTVDEGARAILNLACSPELAGHTGLFFDGLRESRARDQAYDAEARARLRRLSMEFVQPFLS